MSQLQLDAAFDLAKLVVADDGAAVVRRGLATLYPVQNGKGQLYFSRNALGDGNPENKSVLVKIGS